MPAPYPQAMGNEEETGLLFRLVGADKWLELDEFDNDFFEERVHDVDVEHAEQFLVNGMRLYAGGANGAKTNNTNLERATPECADPKELTTYIGASRQYTERMIESYVHGHNDHNAHIEWPENMIGSVRLQRRVRDSKGNTKACHDSFDRGRLLGDVDATPSAESLLLAHAMTRPIVTGAGYVDGDKGLYFFAQKMSNISEVDEKTYGSSVLSSGDPSRIEFRCGDQNISEWATWMRVGSAALVIAMAATPLGKKLERELEDKIAGYYTHTHESALLLNHYDFGMKDPESLDVQKRLASAALDELQLYADLPNEYFRVASEWAGYLEDLGRYRRGELELEALSGRSDWAAKLRGIKRSIARDESFGINRRVGDVQSLAQDLSYDVVRYVFQPDGNITKKQGWGYKFMERYGVSVTSPMEVARALQHPPHGRARVRSALIRAYSEYLIEANWNEVTVAFGAARGEVVNFELPDPSADGLTLSALHNIDKLRQHGIFPAVSIADLLA